MSIIIDIIILALIALFTFLGYRQGLIKSALKVLAFFIAIIIAMIIYKPVANLVISNTTIDENITEAIVSKVLPEETREVAVAENYFISTSIIDMANKTIEEIAESLAVKIIEISMFLILFIVAKLVLMFISVLSTLITKLPIIKQLDKTGGIIYGLIKGFFLVWVILAIISLISPLLNVEVMNMIDKTIIVRLLYKYNLLLIILF